MKKLIMLASAMLLLSTTASAHEAHKKAANAQSATVSLTDIPSGAYDIDMSHSSLTVRLNHFGLSNYTARFTKFDVDLNFDAAEPQNSTLSVQIDPTSIRTHFPNPEEEDFDAVLANDEKWLNAPAFSQISFKATGIELEGDNTGTITGDMAMLGQTKSITMHVTLNGAFAKHPMVGNPAIGFSAHGSLNRSDWGLNTFVPIVSDAVEFIIEAEFYKAP